MVTNQFDIIVIGAGIAGISIAAELGTVAKVAVLEMESQPGYHSTGRSAAYFAPSYGNAVIRELTAQSADTYQRSTDFFGVDVLNSRSALFVGTRRQARALKEMSDEQSNLSRLGANELQTLVPIFNDTIESGLLDDSGGDLDVDAIMQGYQRKLRSSAGSGIFPRQKVTGLTYKAEWHVQTEDSEYRAPIVVNAAGAWADHIANIAGFSALGITPKRRTAILVDPPQDIDTTHWPLVVDIEEAFYFKPDAGKLLLSPADETPTVAADAYPDELDVAIAVDRVCQATSLQVRSVNHSWAGLRSFAPDKSPVIGFDPRAKGFFWLAGQGGYGVQTAPGAARLAADRCLGNEMLDATLASAVAPDRLL